MHIKSIQGGYTKEASNLEGRLSFVFSINTKRLHEKEEASNLEGRLHCGYRTNAARLDKIHREGPSIWRARSALYEQLIQRGFTKGSEASKLESGQAQQCMNLIA